MPSLSRADSSTLWCYVLRSCLQRSAVRGDERREIGATAWNSLRWVSITHVLRLAMALRCVCTALAPWLKGRLPLDASQWAVNFEAVTAWLLVWTGTESVSVAEICNYPGKFGSEAGMFLVCMLTFLLSTSLPAHQSKYYAVRYRRRKARKDVAVDG